MTFKRFNDHIFFYKNEEFYDAMVGAIELPNKILMIDSGFHVLKMKQFKEWVEKETGKKTEFLIITHSHGNHFFGNQFFTDCKIIADEYVHEKMNDMKKRWTKEVIAKQIEALDDKTSLEGLIITPPNTLLNDYMEIVDEDVKVIIKKTGGNTKCSAYVYCPNYSVVFAGDLLFAGFVPYGGDDTCDPNAKAYKEMLSLNATHYVPGHGDISDKTLVEESLEFIQKIKGIFKEMIAKGKTKEEFVERNFKDFFQKPSDTEHDTNLHNATLGRWYDVWKQESD